MRICYRDIIVPMVHGRCLLLMVVKPLLHPFSIYSSPRHHVPYVSTITIELVSRYSFYRFILRSLNAVGEIAFYFSNDPDGALYSFFRAAAGKAPESEARNSPRKRAADHE